MAMMGPRQVAQCALFYEFSLENHVPADHLLRAIDRFVDLSGIRRDLAPFYSAIGRPSIDPELMIRMLLVGYAMGVRSERRLCEEVHLNLAYRWFCRLDLTDPIPDHSTFSKNRHGRFRDSDLLRRLFETVVARCIAEGLVGGERFAVDASIIRADANKQNATPIGEWPAEKLDPASAPRAVREYLDTLDDAAFGAPTEKTPKFTAHADPASQWTGALKGPAFFAYADNYLIDTDHAIIVDVEATRRAPGRDRRGADDDRPDDGSVWPLSRRAGGGHRLRLGRHAGLAGRGARDRAAHPRLRQIRTPRRRVSGDRLRLRPPRRRLHLSGRQNAEAVLARHRAATARGRTGWVQAVLRAETGLCRLRAETTLHAEPADAQALALTVRGRSADGARHRRHGRLRRLELCA
jgi:transposase